MIIQCLLNGMDPTTLTKSLGISQECIELVKIEQEKPPTEE